MHDWLLCSDAPLTSPLLNLEAAGYRAQQLQEPLRAAVASLDSLTGGQQPDTVSVPAGLAEQLNSLGLLLSNLPVPLCCNNPHCTNLSGPSELQLVNGRSCICGGCHVARYCSKACQRTHWKQHKPVCQTLQAAKATAA